MTEKIDARTPRRQDAKTPRRQDAKLPEGNVQATRTYLELREPGQFRPAFGHFPDVVIERVRHPPPELYRVCYRPGGEATLWRAAWDWRAPGIAPHPARQGFRLPWRARDATSPG